MALYKVVALVKRNQKKPQSGLLKTRQYTGETSLVSADLLYVHIALLAVFADNSKQPQPTAAVLEHRLMPLLCTSYFPPIPLQKCSQLPDYNIPRNLTL
jgi:hypothetical protein